MFYKGFANNEYYHIYNRGVDKRSIFLDDRERVRFMTRMSDYSQDRVTVVAHCLMDNHYHLLLQQNSDSGVSKFMQRLGNSYTKYFNRKNDRCGRLFESKYKSRHVYYEAYLVHLIRYIHMNPL